MRRPVPGDTLRRPARTDTVRVTRDSVTVAAPIPPRDSSAAARSDSIRGIPDSLATRKVIRDSIKAPLTRAELPTETGLGPAYRWTRDSLFATGALSALDLLDRVPGLTGFRSGHLASVQTAAYLGDFRRVRVFRDGVELDGVDPRAGGILELGEVQLWQLDEVRIERAAGEVRVHLRTWTVQNTTPYTRVDIGTGDDDTNLYRAFFGRRFTNGATLQVAAQNFGTGARNRRVGGGGDAVSAMARVGWARGLLSVDAFATRVDRNRNPTLAFETQDTVLVRAEPRRDEGYVRVGYGDPERGAWIQGVANALSFRQSGTSGIDSLRDTVALARDSVVISATGQRTTIRLPQVDTLIVSPRSDSTAGRIQYVLTGGFTRWGVRLSATERMRVFGGRTWHAPAVRAAYELPWLSVSAFGERSGADSTTRVDLTGRVQPLRWLAALGAISRASQTRTVGDDERRTVIRAELGAQLGRLWLTGGRIVRDGGVLPPPTLYARSDEAADPLPLVEFLEPRRTGTLATARGRAYRDVRLDVTALRWDAGGAYRPQTQLRAEVRLETNWRRRFPSGNFGLVFAVIDEYRSAVFFPTSAPRDSAVVAEPRVAPPSNTLGALLEIRIQQATVSYQIRNALNREYDLVPGVRAPRPVSFYGVRWNFFN